jgi:phosphoglycerol transferase MdoB-like AlkP superfamily enzyme
MCAITGDPLLPTDLLLIGELNNIADFVDFPIIISAIVELIACVILIICSYIIYRNSKGIKRGILYNILLGIFSVVFFVTTMYYMCIDYDFRHNTLDQLDIKISAFNPIADYRVNGGVLTFFPRIGDLIVEKPLGYSQKRVEEALADYKNKAVESKIVRPNVIAIQNEAWWDPTILKNAEFSSEPMSYIKSLKGATNAKLGFMMSSVFAGGTCIPEFEFLTGMNAVNLPPSTYPYIQSVSEKTPSIVWEFKNHNYDTVAIHPYHKNFYSRDTAYPLLGFDEFIGKDEMFYNAVFGTYISDESLSMEIIKCYEEKTEDRIFVFGVSMENHGGYPADRYPSFDVIVTSDKIKEKDLKCFNTYTQGVFDTDKAFKILTDYFSQVEEPTVILMYGDHLPLLGTNGSTYIDGGLSDEGAENKSTYIDKEEFYHTPYVIWANYDISDLEICSLASPSTLGVTLYNMAGFKDCPTYLKLFSEFTSVFPVCHSWFYKYDDQYVCKEDDLKEHQELIDNYKLLQYDLLHGKKYGVQY